MADPLCDVCGADGTHTYTPYRPKQPHPDIPPGFLKKDLVFCDFCWEQFSTHHREAWELVDEIVRIREQRGEQWWA